MPRKACILHTSDVINRLPLSLTIETALLSAVDTFFLWLDCELDCRLVFLFFVVCGFLNLNSLTDAYVFISCCRSFQASMIRSGSASVSSQTGQEGEIRMALIVVQDMTTATLQIGHTSYSLASSVPVRTLLQQVATSANYMNGTFQLLLQPSGSDSSVSLDYIVCFYFTWQWRFQFLQVLLNERLDETLEAAGFVCDDGHTRNNLIIANTGSGPPKRDSPVKPELSALCAKRITDCVDMVPSNIICELSSSYRRGRCYLG